MAMAVKQGSSRQQHDVKIKFIETQFISSDAASFKAVVQLLTGKSSSHATPPQRPRPTFADSAGSQRQQQARYWAHEQSGNNGQHHLITPEPLKQEPQLLEELYELCDFSDMLYPTASARRDGGFVPY